MKNNYASWQKSIFFILWITYASFYLGRLNLTVAMPGIMADFGWTRADVGAIATAFFWVYAIGQFINGQLGDKLGARLMITIGLTVSALMNLLFGVSQALGVMIVIWAINGYAQSMGWSPIVKTLANWFPQQDRGKKGGQLGTSYILGGTVAVALSGFLAIRFGWEMLFFIPCVLLLLSAIHWLFRIKNSPESIGLPSIEMIGENTDSSIVLEKAHEDKYLGLHYTLKHSIGNTQVWIMGMGLFFVNILRYGFLVWAPTYIFETQKAGIDKAAYSSLVFPLAGILGAIFAGWATDTWFQSRRAPVACINLILAGSLALTYRFFIPEDQWLLSLFILACIGFVVFGAHVLIVAAAPMDFGTRKAASAATGFIDSLGYLGAGLVGIGTGLLVDQWGWNAGFTFWIVSAFFGALLMVLLWHYKPPKREYM